MTKQKAIEIITNALQSDENRYTAEIDRALSTIQRLVAKIPDNQPVKYGDWIDGEGIFECSICSYSFENEGYKHYFNFCPCCGAKNEGGDRMIHFFIPGVPRGKGRPRFGNGKTYTDKATREYEEYIRERFSTRERRGEITPIHEVFEKQCSVEIMAYFAIPKSYSKAKRNKLIESGTRPQKKPDADNIIKVVLDALNGVAYKDDKQVVRVMCEKRYVHDPEWEGVSVRIFYGEEF